MSLYVGGKKYNITMAKWRGFWSVTIHGFPGTIIDCGSQKVIDEDGKVTFKFVEADTYTFIAMRGDKTEVLELELVDGVYFIEKDMYIGVTLLEYIESTGTQWFEPELSFNQSTKIESKWKAESNIAQYLYGAGDSTNPRVTLYINSRTGSCALVNQRFGNAFATLQSGQLADGNIHTTIHDKNGFTLDGVLYPYSNAGTFNISQDITLLQKKSDPNCFFVGKIYYLNINIDDEVIHSFVPAKDSDGVVCLYDMILHQFIYNQGTDDFIAGPVKE